MAPKLKDVAYDYLRSKLISGDFTGGRDLSSQTIGRELGISRTPVREALCQLEREGLLKSVSRSGIYCKQLTYEEVGDLYELRTAIELVAAAQAARRRSAAQLQALDKCCRNYLQRIAALQKLKASGLHDSQLAEIDRQFHGLIFAAAANRFAHDAFEKMHLQTALLGVNLRVQKPPAVIGTLSLNEIKRIVAGAVRTDSIVPLVKAPFLDVLYNTLALAPLVAQQHAAIYRAIRAANPIRATEQMRKHLKYAQLVTAARFQMLENAPARLAT